MELLREFPGAEEVALDLLSRLGPTVLATPAEIHPPLIQVGRSGGSDDRITDTARISVHCFGNTYHEAMLLAEQCRQVVLASPATAVGSTSIDTAETETGPQWVPYGSAVHRVHAVYRIAFRRAARTTRVQPAPE